VTVPTFPVPGRRVDGLVTDPFTGAARWRTDYAGVVWFGHPPPSGPALAPPARLATLDTAFFVPDGHAYQRDGVGDADLQITVGLFRTSGDSAYLLDAVASFADDPRGGSAAYVRIAINGTARIPMAVSYRLLVQTAPSAVLRAT
jgi:hypothetical protein